MPESAAPHPSATTALRPSRNGTAPPMPSEAPKTSSSMPRPSAAGRFRTAMAPLSRMMRRTFPRR
jgi:hypothetical protein